MTADGWILVVDDDDDIRETVTMLLELNGYRAFGASDGIKALEEMERRGRPAGVLLDLRMPHMNGAELARAMRADPSLASVPIVVLSGDAAGSDVPPAAAVLRKPCGVDQLLAVVAKHM